MKSLLLIIYLLVFVTTSTPNTAAPERRSSGAENIATAPTTEILLHEVHFTYFIGSQTFEDWQWFPATMRDTEIEYHYRVWVRTIERTADRNWYRTGATEVRFSEAENPNF